ncbi:ABC transporter permease [Pseudarthrobacter sp. J1763]|uniref:ABC transporter permease n=1 Tax=Pseudarthrobacter sp. J1763 TaxID=3420445 RepID=UPI003D29FB6F
MQWLFANLPMVLDLARQHLILAIVPMLLGLVVSVPLAEFARKYTVLRSVVLTASSLLYTIPSLALFIILPTILQRRILDPVNVIVALSLYAVALLVRAAIDALDSVPEDLRQSAMAMGYKPVRRFFAIDLPLSLPVMFAGLRVVSVSNISLVSVAALLGIDNLGRLFTDGLQRDFVTEVWVGIIATLVLALLVDLLLVLIERMLTPWTRVSNRKGARTREPEVPSSGSSGLIAQRSQAAGGSV